jgi:sortase A
VTTTEERTVTNRLTAPPSTARRLARRVSLTLLVFFAGFVLHLTVFGDLQHARTQTALEDRIRNDLLNGLTPVNGPVAAGTPVAFLEIPAIGVREVVVEGTRASDLVDGPGHLPGSALPGQPGVSSILGRRTAYGGPFGDLDRLVPGDEVLVTTGQGVHTYEVLDTAVRERADAAAFIGEGNMLLLITGETSGWSPLPDQRLVVRSVLVSDSVARGIPTRSGPATLDDLGLEGESGATAALVAWLQLLALVGIGTVLVARRLGGPIAWVIGAPPVVALSILVWEQLALVLPALT